MAMTGALGPIRCLVTPPALPGSRTGRRMMGHAMRGDWMLMGHTPLNGVYDGRRPARRHAVLRTGMAMVSARRDAADGDALTLRAMLSPDPFMGKRGYPLLLAAGETADGEHPSSIVSIPTSSSWSFRGPMPASGRRSQRIPVRGTAGRASLRAAGVHASHVDDGEPGGADHTSLARLDAHQLSVS